MSWVTQSATGRLGVPWREGASRRGCGRGDRETGWPEVESWVRAAETEHRPSRSKGERSGFFSAVEERHKGNESQLLFRQIEEQVTPSCSKMLVVALIPEGLLVPNMFNTSQTGFSISSIPGNCRPFVPLPKFSINACVEILHQQARQQIRGDQTPTHSCRFDAGYTDALLVPGSNGTTYS